MALIGSLATGVSALDAFSKGMEVIGDNIANVNTTAFKDSTANYADAFANLLQGSAASPSSGNGSDVITRQVGEGVQISSIKQNFSQGSSSSTGVSSDFAVSGNGYFQVKDQQNGTAYATRAGDFRVDDSGYLVTTQGYRVQGLSNGTAALTASVDANGNLTFSISSTTAPSTVGDLKIDSNLTTANGGIIDNTGGAFTAAQIDAASPKITNYTVNNAGSIQVNLSDGESYTRGQFLLQSYQDPNALVRQQGNLYTGMQTANPIGGMTLTAANNSPNTNGNGMIQQGSLELSNVDLTNEFANLINTQRSFQAGSRVITTADQLLQTIVNLGQG
ncbi:MAG: flagellar hook-basal body complex protein [Chthoniobacteraceae bacterium]